jgi:hypothetical protein
MPRSPGSTRRPVGASRGACEDRYDRSRILHCRPITESVVAHVGIRQNGFHTKVFSLGKNRLHGKNSYLNAHVHLAICVRESSARDGLDPQLAKVETLKPGCFAVQPRNAPPQSKFKSDDRFPMTRAPIAAAREKRFQVCQRCVLQVCPLPRPRNSRGLCWIRNSGVTEVFQSDLPSRLGTPVTESRKHGGLPLALVVEGVFCPLLDSSDEQFRATVILPLALRFDSIDPARLPFTGARRRRHGYTRASHHTSFQSAHSTRFSSPRDALRGRAARKGNKHLDAGRLLRHRSGYTCWGSRRSSARNTEAGHRDKRGHSPIRGPSHSRRVKEHGGGNFGNWCAIALL